MVALKSKNRKETIFVQTAYGKHRCIFEADTKGFVVSAPDLPGVVTWGKNLKHAKAMVKEAIELCIECCVDELAHSNAPQHSSDFSVA